MYPCSHGDRVRELVTGREGDRKQRATSRHRHRRSTCGHRAPPGEPTIAIPSYTQDPAPSVISITMTVLLPDMGLHPSGQAACQHILLPGYTRRAIRPRSGRRLSSPGSTVCREREERSFCLRPQANTLPQYVIKTEPARLAMNRRAKPLRPLRLW